MKLGFNKKLFEEQQATLFKYFRDSALPLKLVKPT